MRIALDIDDTITYAPEFFSMLTRLFQKEEIIIVSAREEMADAEETLAECDIFYDRIILATDPKYGRQPDQDLWKWKADVIKQIEADVFFEDSPEIIQYVEAPTKVFMACDEIMQQWISRSVDT